MIRHRVRLVLALLAVLAVALVPASELGAQGKGTIKVATQSPPSGGQAAPGEGIKLGTQLAVEQLRGNLTKQGFKVELVPFDDQAKPDAGVAHAKNIISHKHPRGSRRQTRTRRSRIAAPRASIASAAVTTSRDPSAPSSPP